MAPISDSVSCIVWVNGAIAYLRSSAKAGINLLPLRILYRRVRRPRLMINGSFNSDFVQTPYSLAKNGSENDSQCNIMTTIQISLASGDLADTCVAVGI